MSKQDSEWPAIPCMTLLAFDHGCSFSMSQDFLTRSNLRYLAYQAYCRGMDAVQVVADFAINAIK